MPSSVFNEPEFARVCGGMKGTGFPRSFPYFLVAMPRKGKEAWEHHELAMNTIRKQLASRHLPPPGDNGELRLIPCRIPHNNPDAFFITFLAWYDVKTGLKCYHSVHGPDKGDQISFSLSEWGDRPVPESALVGPDSITVPAAYRRVMKDGEEITKKIPCAPGICPQSISPGFDNKGNPKPPACRMHFRLGLELAGDDATGGVCVWRSTSVISEQYIRRMIDHMVLIFDGKLKGKIVDLVRLEQQAGGGKRKYHVAILRLKTGQSFSDAEIDEKPWTPMSESLPAQREYSDEFAHQNQQEESDPEPDIGQDVDDLMYTDEPITWGSVEEPAQIGMQFDEVEVEDDIPAFDPPTKGEKK